MTLCFAYSGGKSNCRILTAGPWFTIQGAGLLRHWYVDTKQPDTGLAEGDSVAVNDPRLARNVFGHCSGGENAQGQNDGGEHMHIPTFDTTNLVLKPIEINVN